MAKKKYPMGDKLARILLDVLAKNSSYEELTSGLPFYHISFAGKDFNLYFKCVTHEGNPYPQEHRRAQLPSRPEFEKIKVSTIPFLLLGYDVDNDVFVCWEPAKVKARLNKRKYVSFYSRLSIQESVVEGRIREEYLTNGDKFVLFKRNDAVSFFQMIDVYFDELKAHHSSFKVADAGPDSDEEQALGTDVVGRITDVGDDKSIMLFIDNLPTIESTMRIVAACMNTYSCYYPKMSFADWTHVIKAYLKKKTDNL